MSWEWDIKIIFISCNTVFKAHWIQTHMSVNIGFFTYYKCRRNTVSWLLYLLECSLGGLMLKLKLQYFGHLMRRTDSFETWCWERLRAGGEGVDRGQDGWMASQTRWTWVWVGSASWWWTRRPGVLQSMGWQRVRHDWATELNWLNSLDWGPH